MQTTAAEKNEWMNELYVCWAKGEKRREDTEELLQALLRRPRTEAAAFTHIYTYIHTHIYRERKPSLGLIKRSLWRHYIRARFTLPCFSSFICSECSALWRKKIGERIFCVIICEENNDDEDDDKLIKRSSSLLSSQNGECQTRLVGNVVTHQVWRAVTLSNRSSNTSFKNKCATEQEKLDPYFTMEIQFGHLWVDQNIDQNQW